MRTRKFLIEILELKSKVTEIKISLDGLKNKLEKAEEIISELEDRSI